MLYRVLAREVGEPIDESECTNANSVVALTRAAFEGENVKARDARAAKVQKDMICGGAGFAKAVEKQAALASGELKCEDTFSKLVNASAKGAQDVQFLLR